jgi:hypothetical protein
MSLVEAYEPWETKRQRGNILEIGIVDFEWDVVVPEVKGEWRLSHEAMDIPRDENILQDTPSEATLLRAMSTYRVPFRLKSFIVNFVFQLMGKDSQR